MGNSASLGLGSSANHGLRDVELAESRSRREVERPTESQESNTKSPDTNRKSQQQLPVPSKPYITIVVIDSNRICSITATDRPAAILLWRRLHSVRVSKLLTGFDPTQTADTATQ